MKPKDTNGLLMQARFWEEQHKVIDQLREVGLEKYIELPTIAVMGDRSSGKSSLLSALSGISFPSNDQLTTRCPTQLNLTRGDVFHGTVRLVRFQTGSYREQMEATEDLKQLEDVPNAISKLTKKIINDGLIISNDQIVIEVCGPEIPELTLIDLPGLVRTAKNLKDKSMTPRVQKMVDRYMKKEQIVVIAVVPANKDMHNSEILKTVQAADPDGTRTIAVVTKLDLVNAGAEKTVLEFLLNKNKQMHLGYHAVKCRNQRDLTTGMSIEIGLANERTFFRIPTLTKRIISILQDNTRKTFQNAIAKTTSRLIETKEKLSKLGTPLHTPSAQRQQFCEWVKQYLQLTKAAKNGQYELFTSIHGLIDTDKMAKLRLRALLQQEDLNFQSEIETTTTEMCLKPIKAQTDVEKGDRSVVYREGLKTGNCTSKNTADKNEFCKELPLEFLCPPEWDNASSVTNANIKQFIRANRGDELAVFPSYRVFCSCVQESVF
ncbi:uncharacterized protein CCR75_009299 [Bremia lactucae]|uniref:Dynamin-type G domain-containing protein n=1 Tax=Bremia lactucae TaxID=4779 RepID=A0A976IC15_BRELC|nr:hypothetical protein CCR75_009299 [Bremia lactucae]